MTPGTLAMFVGLAASTGLGYRPVGPAADLRIAAPRIEAQTSVDLTPKASSGHGWNVSQRVLAGSGRIMAGVAVHGWSDGAWRKASVRAVAGYRVAPGVRVLADWTVAQTSVGKASNRSIGVEVEQGRVRASVGLVVYRQAETRVGVTGGISWRM